MLEYPKRPSALVYWGWFGENERYNPIKLRVLPLFTGFKVDKPLTEKWEMKRNCVVTNDAMQGLITHQHKQIL